MFTGIITGVTKLAAVDIRTNERVLRMTVPYADVTLGESIALNGVCLTVARLASNDAGTDVEFFVSPETCARTNLGELAAGHSVNLERALRLSDRLSGHLVQGHVDGLARLTAIKRAADCYELQVELKPEHMKYVIEKGSIALDGISLTVNSVKDSTIYLMIIPHTWEQTSLASKRVGQDFNVELDMIAKYISNLTKR